MFESVRLWFDHVWQHPLWFDPTFYGWALLALFMFAFVAATVLSLPSEAAYLILIAHYPSDHLLLWGVATTGNFMGACSTLLLGTWLSTRKPVVLSDRAQGLLRRWGPAALLGSSIPVVGDAMVFAAGYLRLTLVPCLLALLLGKGARYALVSVFVA